MTDEMNYAGYDSRNTYVYGGSQNADGNNDQHKKNKHDGRLVALALCCSLLGGVVGAGGFALGM